MKKIGIVTLNGESNYGNRLQNYALNKVLHNIGYDSETVIFTDNKSKAAAVIKEIITKITPLPVSRVDYWKMLSHKRKSIKPFTQKHIPTREVKRKARDTISKEYDFFIVGSDQVWNPNYIGDDDTNFLTFADINKRISYAASFGVSAITDQCRESYRKHISSFKSISVRELQGQEIVRSLTDRQAPVVPDPTILLTQKEWSTLSEKYRSKYSSHKYILIYALNKLSSNALNNIHIYASKNNLQVLEIMGDYHSSKQHVPNPAEFIAMIQEAQAVFTDSFHASVFSIIMHTPFVVFKRSDHEMSSRLATLLKTYNMEDSLYNPANNLDKVINEQKFIDTDSIILSQSRIGFKYLSSALRR